MNHCAVCSCPGNFTCNHFGAKSCKACAAFFRRTISMRLNYICIRDEESCRVYYAAKQICRYCRMQKCQSLGMKPEMVQSKKERRNYIRMSRGLVKRKISESEAATTPENETLPLLPENTGNTLKTFMNLEIALNDRRRLLYADAPIRDVFAEQTDCPYDKKSLKMFNYKSNQGMSKQDFVMIMDYSRSMPGFEDLSYKDKNFSYRLVCAVDFVINSAYYTYKVGIAENVLVLSDGSFIPMVPEPMTGEEENAQNFFENPDDLLKYRTLMPLLIKQWKTCLHFSELKLSGEEFTLLKGICIWHVSYYRLSEEGRQIAKDQRNLLIKALHRVCDEDEERVGNLILGLGYIMEQIRHLNCSFVMISFFGILKVDPLMLDVTSFW